MAPPKRLTKAESAAQTRGRLLAAAGKLYYERGYAATSLADIAEEAGVTKGAVYAHFESKEELVTAVLAASESSIVDLSMFDGDGSVGDKIRAFGRSIAENYSDPLYMAAQCDFASVVIRNPEAHDVFRGQINAALTGLGQTLDSAFADNPDGPFNGTDLVVVFDALLTGLLFRRALNPELLPDDLVEKAIALMFSGFITGIVDPDEALEVEEQRKKTKRRRRNQ